ncbi:MAG: VanZ family protein [Chthoniobacteraceae bacterium]
MARRPRLDHFPRGYARRDPGSDKLGHFLLIGGMAFFLNLALRARTFRWLGRRWLIGSVLVAVAFTLEELSQRFISSRSFDLVDLAADFAGILFFGWLARRFCARTMPESFER